MTRPSNPWAELFSQKNELRLLASLKAKKWQPEACYALLKELLDPLIQSLHFNSHSRWGLQIESQEIHALAMKFLAWMHQRQEWPALEKGQVRRSASLQIGLSRAFTRFRAETGLKAAADREPSYSAKRTMLELPSPHIISQLGGAVLEAFTSLTSQLPTELRLPYQLHLEGLVDDEIAALLSLEVRELSARVEIAKKMLKEPSKWNRAS